MRRNITAGFVPLVDAAPLIAAAERGFAEAEGLRLRLVKQNSWASLRDHLLLGHIDCAQALAPLPIAAALGIGQVKVTTAVPFVLSRGGNAITLSTRLCDEIRRGNAGTTPVGARAWAEALARVVRDRDEPLTLAMVYPFSGHNFELRYWLAAAGIHPDRDVRVVAVPPPLMVDSLRAGHVDGFCVGEPWNSLAAAMDIGEIVARKSDIFPRGIEKVLAMPEAMLADQTKSKPLIRALFAAAFWCDRAENRGELAELLAMPKYLDIDPVLSLQALRGSLPVAGMPTDPDFLFFSRYDANRPRAEEALWLYAQMRRWGQLPVDRVDEAAARAVYRPDAYARIIDPPDSDDFEVITAGDDIAFDGSSVIEYLRRFELSTPFEETARAV